MKRTLLVAITLLMNILALGANGGPREAQWKGVDEAIKKGLPKTAITNLEPIIQAAIRDKDYPEAIKAIGKKIALEGNIQGNKPEEKIVRLQAEIAKAPKPMQPVMEAILAHWYWQYFQQNRWRFMQRTETAGPPSNDILTWGLPRILAEIDKHFPKALAAATATEGDPVAQYDELLQKGTCRTATGPTLYDFIAFEALELLHVGRAGRRPRPRTPSSCRPTARSSPRPRTSWSGSPRRPTRSRPRSRPSGCTRTCCGSTG